MRRSEHPPSRPFRKPAVRWKYWLCVSKVCHLSRPFCGTIWFVKQIVASYFYNCNEFEGQGAELLIRDGMWASADAYAFASCDILHLTLHQHLDQRRKSTGIMETVCVTGGPGIMVFWAGKPRRPFQIWVQRDASGLNRTTHFRSLSTVKWLNVIPDAGGVARGYSCYPRHLCEEQLT